MSGRKGKCDNCGADAELQQYNAAWLCVACQTEATARKNRAQK